MLRHGGESRYVREDVEMLKDHLLEVLAWGWAELYPRGDFGQGLASGEGLPCFSGHLQEVLTSPQEVDLVELCWRPAPWLAQAGVCPSF